jgi:hypothetical protein
MPNEPHGAEVLPSAAGSGRVSVSAVTYLPCVECDCRCFRGVGIIGAG